MTGQSPLLPNFDKPPVIETVLGVFFRPLRNLDSVRQGVFWWEVLRSEFPEFELRAPVDEVVERFEAEASDFQAGFRWQVSNAPETPRLWAKSRSGEHILQLQRNALLANWLRRGEYRPFDVRRTDFEQRFGQLDEYSQSVLGEAIVPVSVTITYINHMPLNERETWAGALRRILNDWSSRSAGAWLPESDPGLVQQSFAFPEKGGRLHATITPAREKDSGNVVVQLELTSRIMLSKEQSPLTLISQGFDAAHEWVVRGFSDITRSEMHELWGRTR